MKTINIQEDSEVAIPDLPDDTCVVTVKNVGPKPITITIPAHERIMAVQIGKVVYPNPYCKKP